MWVRSLGMGTLGAADATVLVTLRPPAALAHRLTAPHAWLAEVGTDAAVGALATAGLWLAAVWFAVGLVAAVAAALPGALGRAGARVARYTLPRALHGLAAGAAGVGVLLSPAVASAAGAAAPTTGTATPVAALAARPAADTPAPVWPSDAGVPTPDWPSTQRPLPVHRAPTGVTVHPGDSLWRIAAEHLPAGAPAQRIAREWPRWYAANRATVGEDPDRLAVGAVLRPPSAARTVRHESVRHESVRHESTERDLS